MLILKCRGVRPDKVPDFFRERDKDPAGNIAPVPGDSVDTGDLAGELKALMSGLVVFLAKADCHFRRGVIRNVSRDGAGQTDEVNVVGVAEDLRFGDP